ncbi:MAG: Gfo/Idh/MocA family oxidoreductase [Candidatus Omnitrophica bacterium]|nr:Gfo/Idh/MocA family oxidoreductase [Candidatus Omnitrophota bacterium]
MKRVRLGIIGVGGMGQAHATSVQTSVKEAKLVAVCDADEKRAKEVGEKHCVRWFTDYKELIDSGIADAVIVATPHYFHPEISVYAMNKGLHVLSEKPIAVTVSQADTMLEAARKTKKVFSVMYQRRNWGIAVAAKKLIEEGKLGEIKRTLLIDPWYRSQAYYDSGLWRATWKGEGGGVLINQAPHMIDIFTWLAGLPKRFEAKVRTRLHNIEVEDEASVLLEYENGAWGYYYTTTNEVPHIFYLEIAGDLGKIIINGDTLRFFENSVPVSKFTFENKSMWASVETKEKTVRIPKKQATHAEIIKNFCKAITKGEKLIAAGVEGINSVEFINAILLSGFKGKPVETPVDREEYDNFLQEMIKKSKEKIGIEVHIETDPSFKKQ